jgi:hypothetical protein
MGAGPEAARGNDRRHAGLRQRGEGRSCGPSLAFEAVSRFGTRARDARRNGSSGLDLRSFRVVARRIHDRSELGLNRLEMVASRRHFGLFWTFLRRLEKSVCSRRRPGATSDNKISQFTGSLTGATGLEPATSGVTGLFRGYDDRRRSTRNRSIHAGLGAPTSDLCIRESHCDCQGFVRERRDSNPRPPA